MHYMTKEVLSQYLRTGCQKQLRLDLSPDNQQYRLERIAEGMPAPQPPRPGLEQIAQAGDQWQQAKLADLANTFGAGTIVGRQTTTASDTPTYATQSLAAALSQATADRFLVEAEFGVTPTFEHALGITA